MQFLIKVITGTPIWVWFLLALLVALGVGRLRESRVSPLRLLVPSVIFVLVACGKLVETHGEPAALAGAVLGAGVGLGMVALLKPERRTRRMQDGTILIAGEWHSLVLILILFWTNYVYGVLAQIAPATIATPAAVLVASLLNFSSTSFMLGRSLAHLRQAQRLQHLETAKS